MNIPRFEQIYNELHMELRNGRYNTGEVFPSLSSLSSRFGVSRPTICKALKLLESKHLISGQHGVGTVVLDPKTIEQEKYANIEIGIDFSSDYENSIHVYNYFNSIVKGISMAAERYKFSIRVMNKGDFKEWSSLRNRPDGLILSPRSKESLEKDIQEVINITPMPIVLINRYSSNSNIGEICVNYRKESCEAISKFIRDGYKRIGICYATNNSEFLNLRLQGWRDAYIQNGLEVPKDLIVDASNNEDFSYGLKELFEREIPDMFFCANGYWFMKTHMELLKNNNSEIRKIKLLCFDDIETFIKNFSVRASYIKMPLEEMGFLAAENIYQQLTASSSAKIIKESIKTTLIL